MKRVLVLGAVLAMAASPALGALNWDFEDGLQGWSIVNTGTNSGAWVAPATTPLLYTDGGAVNIYGATGGNVYLPGDANGNTTAVMDLSSQLVGGSTQSYMLQADVYIPNLRPLTGFTFGYPGMLNQASGITAYGINGGVNSDWGTTLMGRLNKGAQQFRDYTSDAWVEHKVDWIMEDATRPDAEWWNQWITLKIDWNYSSPGDVIASTYIPWASPVGSGGWIELYNGPIEATTWFVRPTEFNRISLGAPLQGAYDLWTKSQFDNVVFDSPDLIPEPASLLLLALGGTALLRRRAR